MSPELAAELLPDGEVSLDLIADNLDQLLQITGTINYNLDIILKLLMIIIVYGVFKVLIKIIGDWLLSGV